MSHFINTIKGPYFNKIFYDQVGDISTETSGGLQAEMKVREQ